VLSLKSDDGAEVKLTLTENAMIVAVVKAQLRTSSIGDRYQVGSAPFEVTQPRVTCYRVGFRLNEPRMPPDRGSIALKHVDKSVARRYRPIPSCNRLRPPRLLRWLPIRVQDRTKGNERPHQDKCQRFDGALLATSPFAQSAASLAMPVENEPMAKLYGDSPRPGPRAHQRGEYQRPHPHRADRDVQIAEAMKLVHHT
jgi:hypothetical protein